MLTLPMIVFPLPVLPWTKSTPTSLPERLLRRECDSVLPTYPRSVDSTHKTHPLSYTFPRPRPPSHHRTFLTVFDDTGSQVCHTFSPDVLRLLYPSLTWYFLDTQYYT